MCVTIAISDFGQDAEAADSHESKTNLAKRDAACCVTRWISVGGSMDVLDDRS